MERNEGTNIGSTSSQTDASGISGGSSSQASGKGFDFDSSPSASDNTQGFADRAKSAASDAGERISEAGSSLRERAGSAKNRLADVLESGAGRLRERAGTGVSPAALDGTDAATASIASTDGRMTDVADRVAGGMQSSAEWLRDADLDSMKASVEQQVRDHPGRTLLIAAGLGYLIGRAFRGSQ